MNAKNAFPKNKARKRNRFGAKKLEKFRVKAKPMTAASVIDERTGERKLLVRFNHTQGRRRVAVLDEGLISDPKGLATELRRHGADLPIAEDERKSYVDGLINAYKRTDKTLAVKPGFKGRTGFVFGPKCLGTAKDTYASLLNFADRQVGYLGAKKGSAKSWQETVGATSAHSSFGIFAACAALCAPLSQYVKDRLDMNEGINNFVSENATFLFLGESSTGKTNLGRIAMSIMGNKPMADWNTSNRALEEIAEAHNNLLLILDDTEKVDLEKTSLKSALQRIAQSIPSGQSRTISGIAQKAGLPQLFYDTWGLATALDSSDAPFEAHGWKPSAGVLVRLIPISIPAPSEGGIFDRLPSAKVGKSVQSTNLTNQLDRAIAANYGAIFPKWIRFLLRKDHSAKLIQLRDDWAKECVAVSDGVDVRLARKFAAVYAAGALAAEAKILAWPVSDIKASVLNCYERALSYRTKLLPSRKYAREKLLAALRNATKFAKIKNGSATLESGMHGVRTKYKGKTVLAVRNNELAKICGSGVKANVINSLYAEGLLIRGTGSAGTIQLPVRLQIGGEEMEKPRFWIFSHAALKNFAETSSRK